MPLPLSPAGHAYPWNKGKLVGPKPPLKLKEVWAIRIRLQLAGRLRDVALFNLAIDSKLRDCDLVRVRVADVAHAGRMASRAIIVQRKTQQPVQFELSEQTRGAVAAWLNSATRREGIYLFPGGTSSQEHLSTRQYARLVNQWVTMIGLDPLAYGTHSLRRTNRRSSTSAQRTFGPYSYCSDTESSKAPCATWESK